MMKKRDTLLPSITTLLLGSIFFFLSCASQNRVKDELDAAGEQTVEEIASTPTEEENATVEEVQAEVANTEQQTQEAAEGASQTAQDDLAALGLDSSHPSDPNATTNSMGGEGLPDSSKNALDSGAASTTAEKAASDPLALTESSTAGAVAVATPDATTETPADTSSSLESVPPSPILEEAPVAPKRRSHSVANSHSRVPKIPARALSKKGSQLNRFYFSRRGDTPSSISTLVYGNGDRARDLKHWNPGAWKPGMLIFYASPVDPGDQEMHSFYQERSVTPEDYTIQRGDWLSKIAQNHLGSPESWKEVAVINGMEKPDRLEVGQKIALYPKDLSQYSGPQAITRNEEPIVKEQASPPAQEQPHVAQVPPPVVNTQPPVTESAPIQEAPTKEPVATQPVATMDTNKFIEQNALAIVILGAAVILGLALVLRKRKAARTADDFSDDNFAPPTKLKRK